MAAAVGEVLPAAAARRPDWPIRLDHCFARVVLDNVYGAPWRDRIAPPAWRNMDGAHLARAVELARRIAEGRADLSELNRRSLQLRGKLLGERAGAVLLRLERARIAPP